MTLFDIEDKPEEKAPLCKVRKWRARKTIRYKEIETKEGIDMAKKKWDIVIGNPPYQLNDGGGNGNSATPVYDKFFQAVKSLKPEIIEIITPSRWMNGGRGLDAFRSEMLNDDRIEKIVDFSSSKECFPGVDIPGGVSYFLWNSNYHGPCEVDYKDQGKAFTHSKRYLKEFPFYIRDNSTIEIIRKVIKGNIGKPVLSDFVSSQKPFGLRSFVHSDESGELIYRSSKGMGSIKREKVTSGQEMIDKYKVILSKVTTEHAGTPNKDGTMKVFSILQVLPPNSVCSESYLVVDSFDTEQEALALEKYLKTKFVRFLVSQTLASMNMSKASFNLVPIQNFKSDESDIDWNLTVKDLDKVLFDKYGLSASERNLIETKMRGID